MLRRSMSAIAVFMQSSTPVASWRSEVTRWTCDSNASAEEVIQFIIYEDKGILDQFLID